MRLKAEYSELQLLRNFCFARCFARYGARYYFRSPDASDMDRPICRRLFLEGSDFTQRGFGRQSLGKQHERTTGGDCVELKIPGELGWADFVITMPSIDHVIHAKNSHLIGV